MVMDCSGVLIVVLGGGLIALLCCHSITVLGKPLVFVCGSASVVVLGVGLIQVLFCSWILRQASLWFWIAVVC